MKIGVVGLGLIGGSFALALKKNGFDGHILGIDNNPEHRKKAITLGLVEDCTSFEDLHKQVDVVLLATPVDAIKELLPLVLNSIGPSQVVMDLGSTKNSIGGVVKEHPNRPCYVSSHPMAGTENTGPEAAIDSLYEGAVNVICDKERSSIVALDTALKLLNTVGMHTIFMDSESHDKHVAYISHLSHISSFMLGQTVLDIEKDEQSIMNLAGSGFASTVRLAMSSPEMWAPIFAQNRSYVSRALEEYINHLQAFKNMIDAEDQLKMTEAMRRANDVRRILKNRSEL